MKITVAALGLALVVLWHGALAQDKGQVVVSAGSQPSSYASNDHFTGTVRVEPAFQSKAPARSYGAYVTFEPGSRTNWHVHPLGQTLIVLSGKGFTQEWGKSASILKPGDIVNCPPGIKHWHGAAPHTAMTHLAISERGEGTSTQWEGKVSDEEYRAAANGTGEVTR